jgi:ethanolamine-phosphate phospho-lyase
MFKKAEVALIDYGDIQRTNTITELAIATAYSILDKPDPLAACNSIISGYHSVVPLQDVELSVLYTLICTRYASVKRTLKVLFLTL